MTDMLASPHSRVREVRICVLYAYDQTHSGLDVTSPAQVRRALHVQLRTVGSGASSALMSYDLGHYPEVAGPRLLRVAAAVDATFPDGANASPAAIPAQRQVKEPAR